MSQNEYNSTSDIVCLSELHTVPQISEETGIPSQNIYYIIRSRKPGLTKVGCRFFFTDQQREDLLDLFSEYEKEEYLERKKRRKELEADAVGESLQKMSEINKSLSEIYSQIAQLAASARVLMKEIEKYSMIGQNLDA